ncbi:MAG: hypothetical protein IJ514_04095 [Clostridia bacterium]|nr:hypothetical protein [Clostridia bacterium]
MKTDLREEAFAYLQTVKEVTTLSMQEGFSLDKETAEKILYGFLKSGIVEYTLGFVYQYKGRARKKTAVQSKVLEYFKRAQAVTLPVVQEELDICAEEAEALVEELIRAGVLERRPDFVFQYTGKKVLDKLEGAKMRVYSLFDEEDEEEFECKTAKKEGYWARIRKELEEKKEKEQEREEKRLLENLRAELAEKVNADDDDDDDDDDTLEEPNELTPAALFKKKMLRVVVDELNDCDKFLREEDHYLCCLETTYPDDTEMQFKLFFGDRIFLSDCGLTMRYMAKYYDLKNDRIRIGISKIFEDYSLLQAEEELWIEIKDVESARASFLFLVAAIERILAVGSENLMHLLGAEMAARCTAVMKRIVLENKASYAQAKEQATALLAEAESVGSEEEKIVYKNVLEAFEGITEENYEAFKKQMFPDGD